MSETRAGAAASAVERPNLPLGVIVAITCLAQFMVVLDGTIVTVALPDMQNGLDLSTNQQQWVVSGYLIAFGGFLLLGARASDLYGRKRVFLLGTFVFTAASLVGGLATNPTTLVVARIAQGVGAAVLSPTTLSIISASHTDEERRERAMTLWSLMGAVSSVFGLVLGGVLTAALDWRWVLFINIPVGVVLLAVGGSVLPADQTGTERTRLDLPGALTATLGIGALTYGFSQVSAEGWGSANVLIALAAAAVLLAAFIVVELKSSHPLIPLAIFRASTVRIGNLLLFGMGVTMTAAMVFLSLYFQEILGYDALSTGLALVPMSVFVIGGGLAARQLLPKLGTRALLAIGGLVTAAGLAWMALMPAYPAYLTHVLGPTLVCGLGLSFMLPAATVTSTTGVKREDVGAASGLLNMSRQIGGAVGLAVLVTIAATVTNGVMPESANPADALVQGYHVAFLVNAAIMFVAGLAAFALPASQREAAE
ncbi:drug resistance transporter, EmrB/QacA subfamily [Saccharopolyspora antimicrobica]|uniref:Drug resistance transporter, EmrB/QacA subfamily n=1 Tax=Saccharopolyspora antimicrobica TaxID=455193 RepID=A0A1I5C3T1_9PSEU|nr:MFS transporter [Saccharopolyspora antimicrobica]RKT88984.1 EmrB/QacA subfamily drug resistance transporter [Saccharopolyspora antimicrobica]SFN81494.1 drug resistance transporter, EmrB/QacA subfamily [Saccharopolyspora antimicrobica]